MLFDTHSHLYFEPLSDDPDGVIARMLRNGVDRAVQIGCDIPSSLKAVELTRENPESLRATVGIHPSECTSLRIEETMEKLESILIQNRDIIVGIGEAGLDYHWISEPPGDSILTEEELRDFHITQQKSIADIQKIWFRAQAELAEKYHLPLIIHTRDAREDTLACIRDFPVNFAIMHCYSEDPDFAHALLTHSPEIYFSFSGILTYKKSDLIRETAKMLPLDRILIETDAPFLAPQPVRGSVNESTYVRYVFEQLCTLRTESPEEIEQTLWENSCRVYGWR